MRYQTTIKKEGNYAHLVFTRKNGETEEIYLGSVKEGGLADQCLGKLYDFHQTDDEFKEGDEILVPDVGTFKAVSFHIVPADEETKRAVLGVTAEKPYRVSYDGVDGNVSTRFATLEDAAAYVKARWQGVDYIDSSDGFHTDYGRYLLFGFELKDIGTFSGQGREREFKFNK